MISRQRVNSPYVRLERFAIQTFDEPRRQVNVMQYILEYAIRTFRMHR